VMRGVLRRRCLEHVLDDMDDPLGQLRRRQDSEQEQEREEPHDT
jgi:hypothetical protein